MIRQLIFRRSDLTIPFPTERLADIALKSLSVDEELSPLVTRSLEIDADGRAKDGTRSILKVHYKATTNRMLRVAVNGFFDSLALTVQVMQELDVDVIHLRGTEDLAGVQGLFEPGDAGETVVGA